MTNPFKKSTMLKMCIYCLLMTLLFSCNGCMPAVIVWPSSSMADYRKYLPANENNDVLIFDIMENKYTGLGIPESKGVIANVEVMKFPYKHKRRDRYYFYCGIVTISETFGYSHRPGVETMLFTQDGLIVSIPSYGEEYYIKNNTFVDCNSILFKQESTQPILYANEETDWIRQKLLIRFKQIKWESRESYLLAKKFYEENHGKQSTNIIEEWQSYPFPQ